MNSVVGDEWAGGARDLLGLHETSDGLSARYRLDFVSQDLGDGLGERRLALFTGDALDAEILVAFHPSNSVLLFSDLFQHASATNTAVILCEQFGLDLEAIMYWHPDVDRNFVSLFTGRAFQEPEGLRVWVHDMQICLREGQLLRVYDNSDSRIVGGKSDVERAWAHFFRLVASVRLARLGTIRDDVTVVFSTELRRTATRYLLQSMDLHNTHGLYEVMTSGLLTEKEGQLIRRRIEMLRLFARS